MLDLVPRRDGCQVLAVLSDPSAMSLALGLSSRPPWRFLQPAPPLILALSREGGRAAKLKLDIDWSHQWMRGGCVCLDEPSGCWSDKSGDVETKRL